MAYEYALSPISIRDVLIRNRVVSTAHTTGYSVDGQVTDELISYHRARAEGGVGLIVLEGGSVHRSFVSPGLRYHSDEAIDGLARLVDTIRPSGTRIFGQLMHGGVQSGLLPHGLPPLSASPTFAPNGTVARAMTVGEIDEVAAGFVNAARLLARAGLDGCEIHLGHGYLLAQFLSPASNRRRDDYGGSLENRLRMTRTILAGLAAVRRPDFVVGVRIGPEAVDVGLDAVSTAEVIGRLEADELLDYVSLTLGGNAPSAEVLQVAPMEYPAGYQLAWNESIARAVGVPTIVTGRFRTLGEADQVVGSGLAQLVGMTRAHIADPEIVRKSRSGDESRIRPCIACNECVLTRYTIGPLHCAVNSNLPTGRGTDDVAPANETGKVLVVGGGVAGLEAARTAALRGHDVVLAEARTALGGAAAIAARSVANLALIDDIVRWEASELSRLGVDVRLGLTLAPQEIRAFDASAVIVATGGVARKQAIQAADPGVAIPGADLPHVTRGPEVFDRMADQLGRSAVVLDGIGTYVALAVCEYLAERGLSVTLVTHFASAGNTVAPGRRVLGSVARLNATGRFACVPLAVLVEVGSDTVNVRDLGGRAVRSIPADTVVLVLGDDPETEIPTALDGSETAMALAGDAFMPRGIRSAISDGHRAGLAV